MKKYVDTEQHLPNNANDATPQHLPDTRRHTLGLSSPDLAATPCARLRFRAPRYCDLLRVSILSSFPKPSSQHMPARTKSAASREEKREKGNQDAELTVHPQRLPCSIHLRPRILPVHIRMEETAIIMDCMPVWGHFFDEGSWESLALTHPSPIHPSIPISIYPINLLSPSLPSLSLSFHSIPIKV